MSHYSENDNVLDALIHFNQYARMHGLSVGIGDVVHMASFATSDLWKEEPYFKHALQCLYCQDFDDVAIFDSVYETYWSQKGTRLKNKTVFKNQSNFQKNNKGTVVMLGRGKDNEKDHKEDARSTSGANRNELLRHTDFALVSKIDEKDIEDLCDQLVKELSMRLRRRMKSNPRGMVDLRMTMRKGITNGGNLIELIRKNKEAEKVKLVLLLDVSGSMDKYSFYLLRFIWGLRQYFKSVEAFTFSTTLLRITDLLKNRDIEMLLQALSKQGKHWSGGTRIGASLDAFYNIYGKRILNGRCMTVVLSDGLETGPIEELERALDRIKRKSKKLVWLNPLKGMSGYEPIQRGMSAALPRLDHFYSAHNLNSLMKLEKILRDA